MRDHNLDDLILDTGYTSTRRAKNLLTLLALVIVVLIVGIVFYKIFLTDQHPKVATIEQNETIPVSPDLTLKTTKTTAQNIANQETQEPQEDTFIEIPKRKSPPPSAKAPVTQSKPTPQSTTQPTKPVAKTPVKPETKPHRVTPVKPATVGTAPTTTRYYIQVGSFSKQPKGDSPLLRSLRRYGYHYTVYQAKGMHKILVGPYKTRAAADQAIGKVRAHIARGAFVFTK